MKTQLNISIPEEWLPQLKKLARKLSFKEDKTMTHIDLIRRAIEEKYGLKGEKND
jgi:hypothetical protein|tara:strand:- start:12864 stop:13028 length:165 start_codon:yes stop_codon:yes gene_type:complete